jgi:phosphorylcholine metabolism protein LicD
MKPSLPVSILEEGLSYWWPKISELEGIPFFGTLLGLIRNGRPIDGDDDIDFILPMTARSKIVELIRMSDFEFSPVALVPLCEDIIQIRKTLGKHELLIDFYFYTQDLEGNCILKWHFIDARLEPRNFLRFSKKLIDSELSSDFGLIKVALPKHPRKIVKFLYGSKWKEPLAKHVSYETLIINGKPKVKVTSKKFLDKFRSKFGELFSKLKLKREFLSNSTGTHKVLLYILIILTISPFKSLNLVAKKIKRSTD